MSIFSKAALDNRNLLWTNLTHFNQIFTPLLPKESVNRHLAFSQKLRRSMGTDPSQCDRFMRRFRLELTRHYLPRKTDGIFQSLFSSPLPPSFKHLPGLARIHYNLKRANNLWDSADLKKKYAENILSSSNPDFIHDSYLLLPREITEVLLKQNNPSHALQLYENLSIDLTETTRSEILTSIAHKFIDDGDYARVLSLCETIPSDLDQQTLLNKMGIAITAKPFEEALTFIHSISDSLQKNRVSVAFLRLLMRSDSPETEKFLASFQKTPYEQALLQECQIEELFYRDEQAMIQALEKLLQNHPFHTVGLFITSLILQDIVDTLIKNNRHALAWDLALSFKNPLPKGVFSQLTHSTSLAWNMDKPTVWNSLFESFTSCHEYRTLKLIEKLLAYDLTLAVQFLRELSVTPLMLAHSVELFEDIAIRLNRRGKFSEAVTLTTALVDNPSDVSTILSLITP